MYCFAGQIGIPDWPVSMEDSSRSGVLIGAHVSTFYFQDWKTADGVQVIMIFLPAIARILVCRNNQLVTIIGAVELVG